MAVETNTPYRRVVGTLIRGVGDGLLGTPSGIPLAGAKVVAEASIRSATSDHYIAFDPVEGITDNNAVLRNAITGEPGLLLVVTDDPSVGFVDWTWHITITAPTLTRPIEFDLPVPSGEGDLNFKDLDPVPGSGGEVVFVWQEAIVAKVAEEVIKQLADAGLLRAADVFGPPEAGGDYRYSLKSVTGTHTFVRFDEVGNIAPSGAHMLNAAGLALYVAGEVPGFQLKTWSGNDTWFGVDVDGRPTEITKWAIVNEVGVYGKPDMPFPYPGETIIWVRPDPTTESGIRAWEVSNQA